MADSSGKLKGTVTWVDVRTGFYLVRSNDSSEEFFVHKSFIAAVGLSAPAVGETVEVLIVKRNNDDPGTLGATVSSKLYIQRGRHLGGNQSNSCNAIDPPNSPVETENEECPHPRLVKSHEDESTVKVEESNWAMLPHEVLSIIFKKAGAVVVLASAEFVCKPWQQLSKKPYLWKCVDIKLKDALSISTNMTNDESNAILLEFLAMVAVGRSEGCLEEFSAEGCNSIKHRSTATTQRTTQIIIKGSDDG